MEWTVLHVRGSNFDSGTAHPEVLSGFTQFLHANAGIVPEIKTPPLPSRSVSISYSSNILPHHVIVTISASIRVVM